MQSCMQSCETIDGDIATSQRYQTAANVSVPSGATKLWSELKEMALCGNLQTMSTDKWATSKSTFQFGQTAPSA